MSYKQLILELPKTETEIFSDLLTEWGALAVTLEDAEDEPLLEPALNTTPLWNHVKLIALFDMETDLVNVERNIKELIRQEIESGKQALEILASLKIETVQDQDWVRTSLDQFKPQCFGTKLWICPSWCSLEFPNSQEPPVILRLDPGLAFGTGTHPSTQLCLEWLDANAPDIKDKLVLDYGCGSGILGLAALKLGAKHLRAIDYDSQALWSTAENAKLNDIDPARIECLDPKELDSRGLDPRKLDIRELDARKLNTRELNAKELDLKKQDVRELDARKLDLKGLELIDPQGFELKTVDIIFANILANPLIELAPKLVNLLAPKGKIILSGILASQQEEVIQAYLKAYQTQSLPKPNYIIVLHPEGWVRIEISSL